MKKLTIIVSLACAVLTGVLLSSFKNNDKAQVEFQQITTVESVIPMGMGRSRMIATSPAGTLDEIKMENFFSAAGINFGNIRTNDKTTTDKISQMLNDGWELAHVTAGVYSGTDNNNNGIFITRYLFKKAN